MSQPIEAKGAVKYHQTRKAILDLLEMLDGVSRTEGAWKLHIDLTCDKIERIYE